MHAHHIIDMCECAYFNMLLNYNVLSRCTLPYTVIIINIMTKIIFMGIKHHGNSEERAVSMGLIWTEKALRR